MVALTCFVVAFGGQRFIALPGTPDLRDDKGNLVDDRRVMFHELVKTGERTFLLDGKTRVTAATSDLYRKDSLRPLVESPELMAVRKKYFGRKVWPYGSWYVGRELKSPRSSGRSSIGQGESMVISNIVQIDRVPIEFSDSSMGSNGYDFESSYKVKDYSKGSPFVIVYQIKNQELSSWSGEGNRRANGQNYGLPYNVILGTWLLDSAFSLKPPSPAVLKVIKRRKRILSQSGMEAALKGLTHEQAAWFYGLPYSHETFAQRMKESKWTPGDYWQIDFKGDRVVSYWRSLPH
jgi:hypothetical protein